MTNRKNRVKFNFYKNIIQEYIKINSWKREDSFLPVYVNEDLPYINDINVIEIEVIRYSINDEDLFSTIVEIAKELINLNPLPAFIIATEHKLMYPNRIRYHKGVFKEDKKNKSKYLQSETFVEDEKSIIVEEAKLDSDNLLIYLDKYFFDSDNCCIFQVEENKIYNENFIKKFPVKYMKHKGTSTIDYFSLALNLLYGSNLIYRIGGDGGVTNISLQIFVHKGYAYKLKGIIMNLIKSYDK